MTRVTRRVRGADRGVENTKGTRNGPRSPKATLPQKACARRPALLCVRCVMRDGLIAAVVWAACVRAGRVPLPVVGAVAGARSCGPCASCGGSACESVRFRIANVNLSHSVWLWACGAGPTRRFQKNILRNELSKLERRAPGCAVGVRLTSPREIAHDHPDGSRESAGAGDENPRRMPTGRTRHAAAQPRGRAEPGFAPLPITGLTRDAGPPRASQPDRGRSADVRRLHSA